MQQAGGQAGTRGGVAEKAAALPRTGGEYCATSPSPLPGPGVAEIAGVGFGNPGRKLSGVHAVLSKFQVFIGLALNGSCVILKIGKQYDHDDGGAFDALQEEKGRPEGLLIL